MDLSDLQRCVNECLIKCLFHTKNDSSTMIVKMYSLFFHKTKYEQESLNILQPLVDYWIQNENFDELTNIICLYTGDMYDLIDTTIQRIMQCRQYTF